MNVINFLIFLILLLTHNSCKEHQETVPLNLSINSGISIDEAKNWFINSQNSLENNARISDSEIEREIQWDFARHVKNKKNREGVIVPIRFKKNMRLALTVQDPEAKAPLWIQERALIFKDKKGKPTIYILQFASLNSNNQQYGTPCSD